MNRLQEKYNKDVVAVMKQKFGYDNDLAVPRILKVTINCGTGKFKGEQKVMDGIEKELSMIVGQKAVFTQAKKAIASFKTREGQVIGIRATLRGRRMYDFLDRLISLALPRTRDFRGLPMSCVDSAGNLNVGIKEQIIFPEISHDQVQMIFGFEINVTTSAKNQEEGLELFKLLGFPLSKEATKEKKPKKKDKDKEKKKQK